MHSMPISICLIREDITNNTINHESVAVNRSHRPEFAVSYVDAAYEKKIK